MDEGRRDGPLRDSGGTDPDQMGTGGPHTHPVSAPNETSDEPGTPRFSKGPNPQAELQGSGLAHHEGASRGTEQPEHPQSGAPVPGMPPVNS
jgi:hypothetical protein